MTSSGHRRAHPRYHIHVPVRLSTELLDLEGEAELFGELSNVAEGGLFVRTEYLEPEGTPVRVAIDLPDGETVELTGRVRWASAQPPRGPGMGIELDAESRGGSVVQRLLGATASA
ncbi:MAG: PilZ domain-containing protein [Myxococcota bacterium]